MELGDIVDIGRAGLFVPAWWPLARLRNNEYVDPSSIFMFFAYSRGVPRERKSW
jgi:hypothetical protein